MKHGTISLVKFKLLARELNRDQWEVVGLLESIWCFCCHNARTGDLSPFSYDEIAAWIGYRDDAGSLIDALVKCKWLDRDGDILIVHDWEEHAPNWLKGVNSNQEGGHQNSGKPPRSPKKGSAKPSPGPSVPPSPGPSAPPSVSPSEAPGAGPRARRSLPNLITKPNDIPLCVLEDSTRETPQAPEPPDATPTATSTHRRARESQEFFQEDYLPESHRTPDVQSAWHSWLTYVLDRDGRLVPAAVDAWAMDAARREPSVAAERLRESVSRLAPSGPYWTELTGSRAGPTPKVDPMDELRAKLEDAKQYLASKSKEALSAN